MAEGELLLGAPVFGLILIVHALRVPCEIFVWIHDTFDINFGIQTYFSKYL